MAKNGFKEDKKPTASQLERRLNNAVIHIDKTKDTQSIYFSDKGLRLTVNKEYAIIETGFHRHVFNSFTSFGISRPWMYVKRILEIALRLAETGDIKTDTGYSYQKMFEYLQEQEDKTQYNIAQYVDWWLFNIFSSLYEIGESQAETWLVFERFAHNLARQQVIYEEKENDVTDKQFFEKMVSLEREMVNDNVEQVIFRKLTDEEAVKKEVEAIQEQELNESAEVKDEGN